MKRGTQKGFSTIEMLIAFAVVTIFLSAAALISYGGQSSGLDTSLTNQGLYRAITQMKDAIASTTENWTADPIPWGDDTLEYNYAQVNTISDISPCLKYISADISTTTPSREGRPDIQFSFGTYIGNPEIALALGGGCNPTPPGDWDNPDNPNWETSPAAIDGTQTGLDYAVINDVPYIFMVTTHSSQKDDLWVIDVSDIQNPNVVHSLEVGGAGFTKGLTDIDVVTTSAGTYAYVTQNAKTDQLKTIDLSDPTTLDTLDITSTISFETYGVLQTGSDPEGRIIHYYDGKLYAGLKTTEGPELLVFDAETDPAHPSHVGSIASGFNHTINDIAIHGDYAYLATGYDSRELMIVNISASTPVDTGLGFNTNQTANDNEDATSIYLLGSTLYLGRERVNNASERDLYVFDISNATSPTVIKSKNLSIGTGGSMGTPRVLDLIVQGHIAFIATTNSTKPFQVYDVLSNPTDIVEVNASCPNYLNLPKLIEMIYRDDLIFAANGNQAALNILRDHPDACTP